MENTQIKERLQEAAGESDVGECLAEMFAFEVINMPKEKPHFKQPFMELVERHMVVTADNAEVVWADED